MYFLKNITCFGIVYLSLSVQAQLSFDSIYQTEYLREQFAKAEAEKDSAALGMAAYKLGLNLEWEEGLTAKVIDLMTLSLTCLKSAKDTAGYYFVRPNLAEYYIDLNLFSEAEKILLESKAYYNTIGDLALEMHMTSRLAQLYKKIGDSVKHQQYTSETRLMNITVKDTLLDIIFLVEKTYDLKDQEKFDSALIVAHQSLALCNAINKSKFAALNMYNIGILNQFIGELDTAIFYLKKAEKRDRPVEYSEIRQSCFRHLSQCYKLKNDFKNAYQYVLKYAELSDSILNKNRTESLDKITLKYETKEKQAAIENLEKENTLSTQRNRQKSLMLLGLSILFGVLLVALWFLIRFYREKINNEKIIANQTKILNENKIRVLENDLQLTSIKSMLDGQETERSRIARDLHDSLGGLISSIKLQLENTTLKTWENTMEKVRKMLDEAASEIRSIAHNLQPSALDQLGLIPALTDLINYHRQPNQFPNINFQHYNVPKNLDASEALQLYRIVQEALTNAIKHTDAKEVLIQVNGESNGISILVEDDGHGFDSEKEYGGSGLKNIRKRAEFLQAEFTIDSGEKGTSIFLFYNKKSLNN